MKKVLRTPVSQIENEIVVFSNSRFLSKKFNVPFFYEKQFLLDLVEINEKRMNEARLACLKRALFPSFEREDLFLLIVAGDLIVAGAVIGYNKDGFNYNKEHQYCVKSVSVAPEYQGSGLSKILIRKIFKTLSVGKVDLLLQSAYIDEGKKRLQHNFFATAKEYSDVKYVDRYI